MNQLIVIENQLSLTLIPHFHFLNYDNSFPFVSFILGNLLTDILIAHRMIKIHFPS